MKLSVILITWNRREVLLDNLQQIYAHLGLRSGDYELLLVDNASTDGTALAVSQAFPEVQILRLSENRGMPARNEALKVARGQYILLLDDDSHPLPGTVPGMIGHMDAHPHVGAMTGRVLLPDGRCEASALPGVFIGCAGLLRRSLLQHTGHFPEDFFRQAEEYDLSCRIWNAGGRIERYEDLAFRHNKAPGGRSSALTVRMDARNNLILASRYLPTGFAGEYSSDWAGRYRALAKHAGVAMAAEEGIEQARQVIRDPHLLGRQPMSPAAFEHLFAHDHQQRLIGEWAAQHNVSRVVIASYAKSLYATFSACRHHGLEILAIAEDAPAFTHATYRDTPILPLEQALGHGPQGIVLANVNPAQVEPWMTKLQSAFPGPLLRLWQGRNLQAETNDTRRAA